MRVGSLATTRSTSGEQVGYLVTGELRELTDASHGT
jgi:hypothetical protein